ncbi:MAG TPA: ABC transporter [Verrucomicrobia bacterium]|nr:ABC transporter [Verrucomicrobiota bacterium]
MIDQLADYLRYPFVRHALLVGTLIAVSAALLGVPLILRRLSNMGDSLSHVAFASLTLGSALSLAGGFVSTLVGTSVCSVLLLRAPRRTQTKGDAALAMLSAGMLAAGYLAANLAPKSANVSGDVCTTLFGSISILTLTDADVWICSALSLSVVVFCVWTHHQSLEYAFDEDFARVEGGHVKLYNTLFALVVAVVISTAMRLAGALLVAALLVFPAASALRIFRSYRAVCVFAALLAAVTASTGIVVSVLAGTPVGATVVLTEAVAFGVCRLIGQKGGLK